MPITQGKIYILARETLAMTATWLVLCSNDGRAQVTRGASFNYMHIRSIFKLSLSGVTLHLKLSGFPTSAVVPY